MTGLDVHANDIRRNLVAPPWHRPSSELGPTPDEAPCEKRDSERTSSISSQQVNVAGRRGESKRVTSTTAVLNGVTVTEVPATRDFTTFYRQEWPGVVRLAFVLTGSMSTVEDVAQEAFAASHRQWGRVQRFDRPDAWVRRVVVNLAAACLTMSPASSGRSP